MLRTLIIALTFLFSLVNGARFIFALKMNCARSENFQYEVKLYSHNSIPWNEPIIEPMIGNGQQDIIIYPTGVASASHKMKATIVHNCNDDGKVTKVNKELGNLYFRYGFHYDFYEVNLTNTGKEAQFEQ